MLVHSSYSLVELWSREIDKFWDETVKRNEEKLGAAECPEQSASRHAEDDEEWEVKTDKIKDFFVCPFIDFSHIFFICPKP